MHDSAWYVVNTCLPRLVEPRCNLSDIVALCVLQKEIDDYCRALIKLPPTISESKHVKQVRLLDWCRGMKIDRSRDIYRTTSIEIEVKNEVKEIDK
jgi:hypothetical protein